MVESIIALGLVLLGLFALALQRFYSSVPAKELKRLAARGDHLAQSLYRPVAYGESMRLLLWIVFGASVTGGFVLWGDSLVQWVAYTLIGLTLVAVVVLQSLRLTVRSARIAVLVAPALNWALDHLHTPFDALATAINRFRHHAPHSGLYEKEDLIALIRQQREQLDNRIAERDLAVLERVAQFDEKQAADIVMPMSRLTLVDANDHIGPVLLGELHKSKQNSFLVYQDSAENVVGTLFLRDAVAAKEGGRVADLMRAQLCFVHEDFSLHQVLNAFIRTGQFMLVVVNSFEEAVGVITLAHFMAQLVGESEDDDFTAYENRPAVAAFEPEPPQAPESEQPADESNPETVEFSAAQAETAESPSESHADAEVRQ
ncbi:MAG TPA: CBS domain-containing protein [Candidatus Saccharimonadales bacterium]|nr:CBS domain-containing protein [Candidatus Saccharimonadales bacterium]